MTDNKTNLNQIDLLFSEITNECSSAVRDSVQRAIHACAVDLYQTLENTEDWLRADYSIAINLLESNDEWFAAQISASVIGTLKKNHVEKLSAKPIKKPSPSKKEGKTRKLDDLSLVSKGEFEDWLTANNGIKFLEGELSFEIHEVTEVLSALAGRLFDEETVAIGPTVIFTALKKSIDELEVPAVPQSVVYKAVARSMHDDLKSLYEKIMHIVELAGFDYRKLVAIYRSRTESAIPKLDKSDNNVVSAHSKNEDNKSTPKVEGSASNGGNDHPGGGGNQHFGGSSADVPDSFEYDLGVIPQVAAGGATGGVVAHASGGGEHTRPESPSGASSVGHIETVNTLSRLNASVSSGGTLKSKRYSEENSDSGRNELVDSDGTNQLIGAISQLQITNGDAEAVQHSNLRAWIQNGLNGISGEPLSLSNVESEKIDVTDRFFEVIVDKVGVSGVLEKWLDKLKLTILKIVLRDETFFSDVSHPARQMLNKLAQLSSNERAENKRLEKIIENFIDRVISDFDDDDDVIENVLEELNSLLERQAQAYQRNSDRIARAYEGKQKVADSRLKVVSDLNNLLQGEQVPVVLLELIDKAGWREHLAFVCVRDGHGSRTYKEVLNVVDLILNWLGNETDHSDKWAIELEMELEAPSLIELISKELAVVGQVGYESVLKRLEDCLFNNVDPLLVKVEQYEWPYDKSEKDIRDLCPESGDPVQSGHWYKRIITMKVGDWVEIVDEDGRSRCLRLAWSGSESFRFVFVDSQGMKDVDVSIEGLVEMFKDNRASFVGHEDIPLVDQGLHQMVQSVYEELSSQSSCDVLTGLLNRQAFERGLEQSISGAVTNGTQASLIYIDIDEFNLNNTSYGHHAGDAILKHVSQVIKNNGLENAFCGRLGGNEFGMILTNCSSESTIEVATLICNGVRESAFFWEENRVPISVSIGIADFELEMDSYDSVMRKAGLACESSKANGRNRVTSYKEQDDDQKKRDEMLKWVKRLDDNLDDLLTLRCQEIRPVVDGKNGVAAQSHYEILLGVKHAGQVLPPSMLIEAAEHYGRMAKVDRWVINQVLRWMESNEAIVAKSEGFSINLSGNSVSDDSFLEFILGEFSSTTVSPELICFEITETAAITNLADATEFIRVLKQTGCKFSLDDFGSGLSSYAYIQKLPVDYIKIDGIFICNIDTNPQDKALVKSINELAHFMGMKTVAEYVENYDILEVLKEIGVDHSQGFGIKKPMLLSELN